MIGQTISHYKILEKLGEGGMGVVYKAQDTKLDRTVALKFLPRYLTSDQKEKERFYHEARSVSALNHANVTTVYEIDEQDDQMFLSMEYVEGKTLKKLVEGGEPLSLKRVLEIAIQICDGLAAAHEKAIVHRDIKSENIMITAKGQVKVMDFGLAKVKGATKLTQAGSTLGTAAYMSPEQAQGEEVDHRSDIFSFGVVLYELLTANLPFRGEHQAAMMYSLINEEPQPVARFNNSVTPEVERIVAKALAKDRDDRYQHIDDMLADLRRERKNLEYARTGYLRTTAAVPVQPSQPPAVAPRSSKKKSLRVVYLAGAVVIIVVAALIFNPFNLQVSTQKTTATPEKNSLAVLYFQNIPDPQDKDHVGDMLADLLITSLSQSKSVEVISRERLYDIQKELGVDAKYITPDMASKVAQRAGVTTMLLGSILQQEPSLMVTTRLIDVRTGKILSSERVSGFTVKRVFGLVDTLSLLVMSELTGPTPVAVETKSIAEVTTKSPEAYRSYLEGVELNKKFYTAEANAAFRKAIELDSNFAMAYFNLSIVSQSGISPAERRRLVEKAWQLRDNVNERERLRIEAEYASLIENDERKAINISETILQRYPHEHAVYIDLGARYAGNGQLEIGLETYKRGLAVDSLDKTLWNVLAYGYVAVNRKPDALAAINRYLELAPAEPNPYDSKGDIYFGFGDLDSARYWWQKAMTFKADFSSIRKMAFVSIVRQQYDEGGKQFSRWASTQGEMQDFWIMAYPTLVALYRGQLNQALKQSETMLSLATQRKRSGQMAGMYGNEAMNCYERGDFRSMLDLMKKRTTVVPDHQVNPLYDRGLLAVAYALNGNKEASAKIMREIERDVSKPTAQQQAELDFYDAVLAHQGGNYDEAVRGYKKALQFQSQIHAPQFFYALSLLKSGHTDEAIEEFQRCTWWVSFDNRYFDLDFFAASKYYIPISTAKAHYWLGVAYEQKGEKDKAIREHEKFLEIWKDADFKSPEMADANARLARLKGMATK